MQYTKTFMGIIVLDWKNAFRRGYLIIAILALICRSSAGEASSLAYQPTNPSFGGPVSNGPTLMGEAQAQNHFTAPAGPSSIPGASQPMTQSELFASQLQSQLLSSLATQVNNAIFGANPQNSGRDCPEPC